MNRQSFPRRLVEEQGALAELVRASLDEPMWAPNEARNFDALLQRRARVRRSPPLVLALVSVLVVVIALLVWVRPRSVEPSVHAERPVARAQPAPAVVAPRMEVTPPAPAPVPSAKPRSTSVKPKASAAAADGCANLAREGKYEDAARCYGESAQSGGMTSELALYEKARIEAKALNRPADALRTLDEHARRFPRGVLATEVGITRIELLSRSGRSVAALEAIDAALSGPLGNERGGDLQALRAELLAARGACDAAMEAIQRASEAGVHASRLEPLRRRCAP
ncbi:MAG: hypothetical protein ACOY0T_29040 [Myxococcota bacterium]